MPPTSVSKWHGVVRNAVDVFAEGEEELRSNCDKDVTNHGGGVHRSAVTLFETFVDFFWKSVG